VCFVDQRFCGIALQTRQPDVEPNAEKVAAVPEVQIDFGIDAQFGRQRDFSFASRKRDRTFETGRPASCEQLLRVGTMRAEPGAESRMSRRPSELREAPFSRPPVVLVLAVCTTFGIWLMCIRFLGCGPCARGAALQTRSGIGDVDDGVGKSLGSLPEEGCARCRL
jgi:hypothetical protein